VVEKTRLAIRGSDPKDRRDFFRGSSKPAPTRLPTHRATCSWRAEGVLALQDGTRQEPNLRSGLPRTLRNPSSRSKRADTEQTLCMEWRRRQLCERPRGFRQDSGDCESLRIALDSSYRVLREYNSDYFARIELLRTNFTKSGSLRR